LTTKAKKRRMDPVEYQHKEAWELVPPLTEEEQTLVRLQAEKEMIAYVDKDLAALKEILLRNTSLRTLSMITDVPADVLESMSPDQRWTLLSRSQEQRTRKATQSTSALDAGEAMMRLRKAELGPDTKTWTVESVAVPGHPQGEVDARKDALERKLERLRTQVGLLDAAARRTVSDSARRAEEAKRPLLKAVADIQHRLDCLSTGTWA